MRVEGWHYASCVVGLWETSALLEESPQPYFTYHHIHPRLNPGSIPIAPSIATKKSHAYGQCCQTLYFQTLAFYPLSKSHGMVCKAFYHKRNERTDSHFTRQNSQIHTHMGLLDPFCNYWSLPPASFLRLICERGTVFQCCVWAGGGAAGADLLVSPYYV